MTDLRRVSTSRPLWRVRRGKIISGVSDGERRDEGRREERRERKRKGGRECAVQAYTLTSEGVECHSAFLAHGDSSS